MGGSGTPYIYMGSAILNLTVPSGHNATVDLSSASGNLIINGAGNTLLIVGSGNPAISYEDVESPAGSLPAMGSIVGRVFDDVNADGRRNGGEIGLAGRPVFIDLNKNGKWDRGEPGTTTATDGSYEFSSIAVGQYVVREAPMAGWRATTTSSYNVSVEADQMQSGMDFGQTNTARISGVVFDDKNGDSKRESGERGLAGWLVYLDTNNDGKLDQGDLTATTNSTGRYSFIVPAGKYVVREALKKGFHRTSPAKGFWPVTAAAGHIIDSVNFGDRE
jgi:hypothetical protein